MANVVISSGAYSDYSLSFLLGNVGVEIERMFNWQRKGDDEQVGHALARALDLLDRVLASNLSHNAKRELLRLREVICGHVYDPSLYDVSPETLSKYFLSFALFSRTNR